jgi:signal transduction histidine kinase
VFDNLVKNALEAIEQGPATVELRVAPLAGDRVRISVHDTGPGIPEGVDIFALFETTKPTGTGLGLPICRQIVNAHGGELCHERLEPTGAVFHVDLPLHGPGIA